MREYRQLTEEDRIEIYSMKQAGKNQKEIASLLGVHPSTISRELARNSGLRGYRPKQAQQRTLQRRFTARKAVKMTPETIAYIESKLREQHSPEQIAERMKLNHDWHGKTKFPADFTFTQYWAESIATGADVSTAFPYKFLNDLAKS